MHADPLLTDIVRSGTLLPQQVALEVHYKTNVQTVGWFGRLLSPLEACHPHQPDTVLRRATRSPLSPSRACGVCLFQVGAWMEFMFTRGGYMLVDRNDSPPTPRGTKPATEIGLPTDFQPRPSDHTTPSTRAEGRGFESRPGSHRAT